MANDIRRGWYFLFFQLLLSAAAPELNRAFGSPLGIDGLNFALYLIYYLGYGLIFRRLFWEHLAPIRQAPLRFAAITACTLTLFYASFYGLLPLLQHLAPGYTNANDAALRASYSGSPLLLGLTTVLLAPLTEETIFRHLIQGSFPKKLPGWIVSAALFSAAHITPYLGTLPPLALLAAFLQYLPAGFLLSGAYCVSRTIWAPILVHTVINAITMLVP